MRLGQRPTSPLRGTARQILEHARAAFNERGAAGVSIREIARDLGISPGNVSYHFATKDALLTALVEDMHRANSARVEAHPGPLDFAEVDRIFRAIMERDLENRWLMHDAVGFLAARPQLRSLHERMQRTREDRVSGIVGRLIAARLLDPPRTKLALPTLRIQIFTQVFFWLPAAILIAPNEDPRERLDAHARAALALFLPCCTPAGRRELEVLLKPMPARPRRADATRPGGPSRSSRRPTRR